MRIKILRDLKYFQGGSLDVVLPKGCEVTVEKVHKDRYDVMACGKIRYVSKEDAIEVMESSKPCPFRKGNKVIKKNGNSFRSGARIAEVSKIEWSEIHNRFKIFTDEANVFLFHTELELAKTGEENTARNGQVLTGTIQSTPIVTGLQHFAPISPFPTDGEKVPAPRPESEHYHTGGVDVWQFADENFSQVEVEGFHRINAIKYLARYGKKNGYNRKDLEKAIVSIEKLIELHDKDDRK